MIAAILVLTLPEQLRVSQNQQDAKRVHRTLQDIRTGHHLFIA
ncbi:MAG: hypothetical protein VKJ64_12175 [Leptolyngbyaceae bacterium]|nr:hypothetical protein [Leptolyngbyaceae bacterium]